MYDYSKLLGRIIEKFKSQANFSEAIGLSERSLSRKLTGKVDFKQSEIAKVCKLLELTDTDIPSYFFTLKVQLC